MKWFPCQVTATQTQDRPRDKSPQHEDQTANQHVHSCTYVGMQVTNTGHFGFSCQKNKLRRLTSCNKADRVEVNR